jgi:hypothetical protein
MNELVSEGLPLIQCGEMRRGLVAETGPVNRPQVLVWLAAGLMYLERLILNMALVPDGKGFAVHHTIDIALAKE